MSMSDDEKWMKEALGQARKAASLGEVPIGAVIVHESQPIAFGFNWREKGHSPLGHAELIALHRAARKLGRWRLLGCTLYVNLEPCVMCAGAIVNSRIDRVVFGARDPKAGAVHSLFEILSDRRLNHRPEITEGVLENESSVLLKSFFKNLREKNGKKS